jgi:hypothetical protein
MLALIILVFSLSLTFSDAFYTILSHYTNRPELLPFPLLVTLMWIIFQVMLLEREGEKEDQLPQAFNMIRQAHLQEWIMSREILLHFFIEGNKHSQRWNSVAAATPTLVEWILSARPVLNIDILAFSAETFLPACLDAARAMVAQPAPKLEEVNIRILVRDTSVDWMVPYLRNAKADRQYLDELKTRFLHQQNNWFGLVVREFSKILSANKIHLEMRVYPFEPVLKGMVINREIALIGVYPLGTTIWHNMEVWDYLGHEAPMVRVSKFAESPFERISFEMFVKWFDSYWQDFSRPWEAKK